MAVVIPHSLRKWLRFGTGVGIAITEQGFDVAVARAWPTGVALRGFLHAGHPLKRPVAEWGAEISSFLGAHGAQQVPAVVELPRERVIVRTISLPGVSDEDATQALTYQLDTLHPWGDDDVEWAWQRVGQSSSFSLAIAERTLVERYVALFAEAGVRLGGLTAPGSALYLAARLGAAPPPADFIAVRGLRAALVQSLPAGPEPVEPNVEVYAESEARPLYDAQFPMTIERAVGLVVSETRQDESAAEAVDWIDILPAWSSAPDETDLSDAGRSRMAPAWAAALVSACSHLGLPLNLLPAEMRAQASRLALVPGFVLAGILLCLCGALLGEDVWLDSKYLTTLSQQIKHYNPLAKRVEVLDRHIADSATRIKTLDDFRKQTRDHLEVLLELTRKIPPPAVLDTVAITPADVQISGGISQAEGLLKTLDESPLFESSEFTTQMSRRDDRDHFRIRTRRERHNQAVGGTK
jgi:Tfp pilus assembly protein PilN